MKAEPNIIGKKFELLMGRKLHYGYNHILLLLFGLQI